MKTQNTTQHEQRGFIDVENDIKNLLNSSVKNKGEKVLSLLREFENMGFKISKQYLKNLYENKTKKQITNNLSFMLKRLDFETENKNKYIYDFVFKKFKATATGLNYSKTFKISLVYKTHTKKTFNFLVINQKEIKQIHERQQKQFLRSLNLFPQETLKYFFNLTK